MWTRVSRLHHTLDVSADGVTPTKNTDWPATGDCRQSWHGGFCIARSRKVWGHRDFKANTCNIAHSSQCPLRLCFSLQELCASTWYMVLLPNSFRRCQIFNDTPPRNNKYIWVSLRLLGKGMLKIWWKGLINYNQAIKMWITKDSWHSFPFSN